MTEEFKMSAVEILLLEDYIEEVIDAFSDNLDLAANYLINLGNFFNYDKELDSIIIAVKNPFLNFNLF